jgi:hypothetical protein
MSDKIEEIANSLDGLNTTVIDSGIKFQGLTKSLIRAADATSSAGQKWTVFSRLVSGSPIWALQNKARAYLAILGGFEQRSKANAKAQMEANQTIIKQVSGFRKLKEEYSELERQLKKVVDSNEEFNESQEKALQNTLSYSKAILLGKSEREAQIKGAEELNKKFKQQAKLFQQAERLAKEQENMKTRAGRGRIKAGISSQRRSLKKQLVTPQDISDKLFNASKKFETGLMKTGGFIGKSFSGLPKMLKNVPSVFSKDSIPKLIQATSDGLFNVAKGGENQVKRLFTLTKNSERFQKFSIKAQKKALAFQKSARFVLNLAFKYLVFGILAMIAILGVAKVVYEMYEVMKELYVIEAIKSIFLTAIDIAGNFFGLVGAFISGDYQKAIEYGTNILDGIIHIALAGAYIIFMGAYGVIAGLFVGIFELGRSLTKASTWKMLLPVLAKFGKIILVAYFIKYLATQALLLIGIYALPMMMIVLLGALLVKFVEDIVDRLSPFANGGIVGSSPMQIVGERGPELVKLPKGSRVYTNQQSKSMVSNAGTQINNYITINARDTSDSELRRIADKIGNMVNNKMNRTTSTRTLG